MKIYSKAVPQATFADIEKKMREEDFKVFLIALVISPCLQAIRMN